MSSPEHSLQHHTSFATVAVIGLGLIGGSMAKLIRQELPETEIYGLDLPEVLAEAQFAGVVDTQLTGLDDPNLYRAELIILGTHLHQSYDILKQLAEKATGPIYVMDLGSTKTPICQLAESLSENLIFIGGHPLAGREVSGFTNSRWDLFHRKRFLLTPCTKTTPEFKTSMVHWLKRLDTHPIVLEMDHHDQLMAMVSHFPQFYAIALANLLDRNTPNEALQFLGGGIDDQMRLMASPYAMWNDVFQDNKPALNTILTEFIDILTQMQQALQADTLAPWFKTSQEISRLYQQRKQSPAMSEALES
jgi:prephenate dehydrogenase